MPKKPITPNSKPKVSIIGTTYNHEKYIAQALESFVMQQTDFTFEVIIADDYSSDQTAAIINDYANKYPEIFRPILRDKNVGLVQNFLDVLRAAKGEYIAICEGDDYWTDPLKLQRQVEFLDNNNSYALCFHPVDIIFENQKERHEIFPDKRNGANFNILELLGQNFIQTNSVMYRRQNYDSIPTDIMPLDWYLHLYHAQFGKIGFLDQVMSAYRRHSGGVWWESHNDPGEIWRKQGVAQLGMFVKVLELYGDVPEYREVIESQIIDMFNRLIAVDAKHSTTKVREALVKYPEAAELFLLRQNKSLQYDNTTQEQKEVAIRRLLTDLSRSMEETLAVKHSKSFVLGYALLHPWKLPRKLAGSVVRKSRAVKLELRSRKDLKYVDEQYDEAGRIIRSHPNTDHKKTVVVLHLYYTDLWDYFEQKLQNLDYKKFDLFVSVPIGQESAAQKIIESYPDACIVPVPNRGRDVLPFVKIISNIKSHGYQKVLKIHSKKSKHIEDGNKWLTNIIDELMPYQENLLDEILDILDKKDTALIGPREQYISLAVNYEANKVMLRKLVTKLKSSKACQEVDLHRFEYGFFAGTMFWAKLDAIQHIIDESSEASLFGMEQGQIDNTYAHAIERAFALIPEIEGKKIYGISGNQLAELEYPTNNIPSWSDVYTGPKDEE